MPKSECKSAATGYTAITHFENSSKTFEIVKVAQRPIIVIRSQCKNSFIVFAKLDYQITYFS